METAKILEKLKKKFSSDIKEINTNVLQGYALVSKSSIKEILKYLKDDKDLKLDHLRCLSGVDNKDNFSVVYHLYSYSFDHAVCIKAQITKDEPSIETVSDLWGVANWHEREVFDLFGITFKNHPDLTRILLPEDWVGHPLRKDYIEPEEYRNISHKR